MDMLIKIVEKMYADKKVVSGSLNLILLRKVGQAEIVKEVNPELIKEIYVQGGNKMRSKLRGFRGAITVEDGYGGKYYFSNRAIG